MRRGSRGREDEGKRGGERPYANRLILGKDAHSGNVISQKSEDDRRKL